jgi:predicted Rossmann-fold nucleotide-binding protein
MLDHAIDKNFIYPEHRGLYRVSEDPLELLRILDEFIPPENLNRWLVRE